MSYLRREASSRIKLAWGTVKTVTCDPTGWRLSVQQQDTTSHHTVTSGNKSKATLCRSGETLISLGGRGSQISTQLSHENGKVVSPAFK
jgi:hypothetical protein